MLFSRRPLGVALLMAIVGLTLATAYIHFWVGGILLLLNAAGYLGLALAVVGSAVLFRRALPLVLVALAGYAGVTIVGWAIIGPYFDVAYLAKAIELALISAIALVLWTSRADVVASLRWARSTFVSLAAIVARRPAGGATRAVRSHE